MMKVKVILISMLCAFSLIAKAQDIHFSQFYELPLLRNPALAGLFTGDVRVTSAYRNQWASVSTPYVTQALGADVKFALSENSNDYLAVGLQITNDIAGDSKLGRTQLLPAITLHKSINAENDTYVSVGFLGGPVQQRFDVLRLKFDDQFVNGAYSSLNPTRETFENTNHTYYDASVGILFSTVLSSVKVYVGGSYFHFTEPRVAFSSMNDVRLNKKYFLNAGLSVPTSETDQFILYGDLFFQGGNREVQGGAMWKHDIVQQDDDLAMSISAGAFYRSIDAVVPVFKFDYYNVGLGLTYDVNVSKLTPASQSRGGLEVTLSYKSFLNIRSSSAQKVRCPVGF